MLNNRYNVTKTLGQGGWGTVVLATDTRSGQPVAIKRIAPHLTSVSGGISAEVAALATLDHPYVVKYLDSFIDDNCLHIVTEYVEGQTLSEHRGTGAMALTEAARYTGQILDALEHIHSHGIIHSDLKPDNILIDAKGDVRIIDFGVIRTPSAEIAADIKEIRGTLLYMSPEQAEGKPYDVRSDLFSLGIILYELCTGRLPFAGDYDMAVVYAILYEEPVSPEKINPEISSRLAETMMELLAKNPSDRCASAADVRNRLTGAFSPAAKTRSDAPVRIAVLPLEYPPDDADSRLIADGLGDELHARLRTVSGLDVVSPIQVARQAVHLTGGKMVLDLLGADNFLTGTVRRIGTQIRIYLMLIRSADDSTCWSDKFDNPLGDLFNIIDFTTEKVAAACAANLTAQGDGATAVHATTRPEAYELYLLARGYYVKNTRQDLEYARNMYREAMKVDPRYAQALVGLADCRCQEYMNYYDRREETTTEAQQYANQALALIPHLPEAHRALGRILQVTGKVKEAAAQFLKAVTYKDDYYQAYRSLGWLAKDCYRYEEALGWVRKSLSINSTDLETIFLKGVIHFELRESKRAVNDLTRCLELRPDYGRAHCFIGMTYFQLGWVDQAIASMKEALRFGGDINAPYLLGYYYLAKKDYDHSRDELGRALAQPEIVFLVEFYLGMLDVLTHDSDAAVKHFDIATALCLENLRFDPDSIVHKTVIIRTLAYLGRVDECRQYIKELLPYLIFDGSVAHDIAKAYAILGENDNAKKYAKMAIATALGPTQVELGLDPLLAHLIDHIAE